MSDFTVVARGLVRTFEGREVVAGVDLTVRSGESLGLLGPNGAGKTTTMRMISGVLPRTSGDLLVLGHDPDVDGRHVRAGLGVVSQDDTLDADLTVRENLVVYGRYFGLSRAECRGRADRLLETAGLADRARSRVDTLSGGMRRRLSLARALVSGPRMLILDEPTTGLDPQARHAIWDQLYRLKASGVTLVLTTHFMDEAEQLCDRVTVMDRGRVVTEDAPRDLIASHSTREVLELRLDGASAVLRADLLTHIVAERIEVLPDRVLLYVEDGEAALASARERGITSASSLVRRSNLEDVFLRLTGRALS